MDGLKLDSLENIKSLLLVSCGGILGSNIRFLIFQSLDRFLIDKKIKIIIINTLATFLIGFSYAILADNNSLDNLYQLRLLIVIGFLGGLSTFSTFMYDLFELFCSFKVSKIIKIVLLSLILGLCFLLIGVYLGNQ